MSNVNAIDAKLLSKMFLAAAKNLEAKKDWINELNVFPVPDGDTGTNMTMTIMSAAKEVSALETMNDVTMESLCKAISSGSLRGARGNSGVILSQLLRGFTKVCKPLDTLEVPTLAEACIAAVDTAYKAVMKPKEGTILTVAKGVSDKANELSAAGVTDIEEFLNQVIQFAEEVLAKTPDMLPVLKQAGVVDSGGQGLVEVLHGAQDAFLGKEIDYSSFKTETVVTTAAPDVSDIATSDIKFGYCTEFIIMLDKVFNIKHEMDFKSFLESIGDSIVVVADDEIVKVHVHTNDPGLAIQKALKYGSLSNMKIDNMRLEHQERLFKSNEVTQDAKEPVELKDYGFIAVSAGSGLSEIFKGLGCDYVIEGGQTMNPSTEDIVNAINQIPAKTVFVFPNNKNIIMAANQAQYLVEDKNVVVIPTKTIPQGISALINFMPDDDENAVIESLNGAIATVKSGEVTYSIRDTKIDDKEIKEGDFMGIGDTGLLSVSGDLKSASCEMIDEMILSDNPVELLTIYYGEEVTEDQANEILSYVNDKYPDIDVEVQYGGQPIYYYIVSAE